MYDTFVLFKDHIHISNGSNDDFPVEKKKQKRVNDSTRAANGILDYSTSCLYVDWENSLQISHTKKIKVRKPPAIVIGHGAYFGYLDRSIQSCANEWCSVVRSWSKHISVSSSHYLIFKIKSKVIEIVDFMSTISYQSHLWYVRRIS